MSASADALDSSSLDTRAARRHRFLPLLVLLRFRVKAIRNQITNIRRDSLLKIGVVSVLGLAFWAGLFVLFLFGFEFINVNAGFVRTPLIHHILSLFFMALTFMLIFSNAVISLQNLFREHETAFLFSLPLRHDTIFLYKFIESLVFSSWAVFAAGLPLMLAYGIKSDVDWYFYPLVLVFMAPFVVLPAAIGTTVGLLLTAIVPRQGKKLVVFCGLLALGFSVYLYLNIFHAHGNGVGVYAQSEIQAGVQRVLGRLWFTQNAMTPNYWITEGLLRISEGKPDCFQAGAIFLGALISSAVFFLVLGWFISGAVYAWTFSYASGGGIVRQAHRRSIIDALFAPAMRRYPQLAILVIKDVKTFLRDATQWTQVLIFFGILALYIGNLRNFSYPLDQPFYQNLISFLNLGATCMTLATLTSRFIFPLISLEGRRFWVLGLAPLERREIMMSKFWFAFSGAVTMVISLVLLSNYILRTSGVLLSLQLVSGLLLAAGLSGMSVGMGAIFPSFQERNPSKIVSGFGGTLTLILAIGLVMVCVIGEGVVCNKFLQAALGEDDTPERTQAWITIGASLTVVAVLNGLAAYVPMRAGIRALRRVEF